MQDSTINFKKSFGRLSESDTFAFAFEKACPHKGNFYADS